VLESGDRSHGATVHFVTAALDAGPAVIQYRILVRANDTPESLAARVHAGEHAILPRAVDWFVTGRLRLEGEAVMLDGRPLPQPVILEGNG
jgi:phosphoribosylglycinamide formyltransferase-1